MSTPRVIRVPFDGHHAPGRRWLGRWLMRAMLAGLLAPLSVGAAEFAQSDARAVRLVIESQLEAFAADDAQQAFSYASTAIQTQFGDAATFMAMVRAAGASTAARWWPTPASRRSEIGF